jgi:hypothetical protein
MHKENEEVIGFINVISNGALNSGNFWCEHGICDPSSVKPSCSSLFWDFENPVPMPQECP